MTTPARPQYFAVGQRWAFATEAGSGTFVIGRIDSGELPAIHVSIESPRSVGHVPFAPEVLAASVTEFLATDAPVSDNFANGVAYWEEAEGSVFTLSVSDALEVIHTIVSDAGGESERADRIDTLVREMRATRDIELVGAVYDELLRLDRWFFLADPQAPTTLVLWASSDSDEPDPCLLAWTTSERAEAFAAQQGWEPKLVAPPVREAIDWILSTLAPNEGINRIEFNMPAEETIALYLETLEQLVPPTTG